MADMGQRRAGPTHGQIKLNNLSQIKDNPSQSNSATTKDALRKIANSFKKQSEASCEPRDPNTVDNNTNAQAINDEVYDSPSRVNRTKSANTYNDEDQNGFRENNFDMHFHEDGDDIMENIDQRNTRAQEGQDESSSRDNNTMMDVNLGHDLVKLDVAAAVGREVLKIFNNVSLEKETLIEENKILTEKNKILVEENISLKLLLAQHGIPLDEVDDFQCPTITSPANISRNHISCDESSTSVIQNPPGESNTGLVNKAAINTNPEDQSKAEMDTALDIDSSNDLPSMTGPLANQVEGGNKENISPSSTYTKPGKQIDIAPTIDIHSPKNLPCRAGQQVSQEGDVHKMNKRANEENENGLNIQTKRRRTKTEIQSQLDSIAAVEHLFSHQRQGGINSRVKHTDNQTQDLVPKELCHDGSWIRQKPRHRQPDKEILEHNRKRDVEVKVFELKNRPEDEGVDEEEIESQTNALRVKLSKEYEKGSESNKKTSKSDQVCESEARIKQEYRSIKVEEENEDMTFDFLPLPRTKAVVRQIHSYRPQDKPNRWGRGTHADDPIRDLVSHPRELNYDEDDIRDEEEKRLFASTLLRMPGDKPAEDPFEEELAKFVKQEAEHKFRCLVPECKKLFKEERFWRAHVEKRHSQWLLDLKKALDLAVRDDVLSRTNASSDGYLPSSLDHVLPGASKGCTGNEETSASSSAWSSRFRRTFSSVAR
ncbi:hypothetical protein EG329_006277 [Mollisiaceae sp. DMI_Dod_QoI]|nr:hypothetical protein EG329_006277 [Helotiales sp. DMI_Dod_QoI]